MNVRYRCPVCGWIGLIEEPIEPYNTHEICSCCGIQLGYEVSDKQDATIERKKWLALGSPWFDDSEKPLNWTIEQAKQQINKR